MLKNKKILIIITGSIAAYKALLLIRLLKKKGCEVNCILTKAAEKFITPLSVSSLTGNVVYNELFSLTDEVEMGHIKLARMHDAILVVPATANFISKTASGLANDLASTLILASKVPTFFFPAMNINMWENSIIKDNVRKIVKSGKYIIQGSEGDLACGDYGYGRLSEPEEIIKTLESHFINVKPLFKGIKALVTAGPTQEPIDPVRFISNNSSGIQGYAIARELSNLGAEVSLISGPTNLECPSNIKKLYQVKTATEMYNVCKNNIPRDLFISVAAKYIIKGEPNPPAPITKTLEFKSFSCPFPPISGSIMFLEYLSTILSDINFCILIGLGSSRTKSLFPSIRLSFKFINKPNICLRNGCKYHLGYSHTRSNIKVSLS